MILVAGGTGLLGRHVVAGLREAGHRVRVLTREEGHAAGLDAEVAVGDVRDQDAVARAVHGCSTVVSAVHGFLGGRGAGPEEVDHGGNRILAQCAARAGVGHVVMLSVYGARADHPMPLHRAKYAGEQEVRASGVPWTILRPTAYLETWTALVGRGVPDGKPALVLGRGENPVNFVPVAQVAAAVVQAVEDGAQRGGILDVVGPEDLTMNQLAERLGATRIRHVSRPVLATAARLLAPVAPVPARATAAAVAMDTLDMTASGASSEVLREEDVRRPDRPSGRRE